jgi:hypothetical protein
MRLVPRKCNILSRGCWQKADLTPSVETPRGASPERRYRCLHRFRRNVHAVEPFSPPRRRPTGRLYRGGANSNTLGQAAMAFLPPIAHSPREGIDRPREALNPPAEAPSPPREAERRAEKLTLRPRQADGSPHGGMRPPHEADACSLEADASSGEAEAPPSEAKEAPREAERRPGGRPPGFEGLGFTGSRKARRRFRGRRGRSCRNRRSRPGGRP